MKAKIIGVVVLLVTIIGATVYYFYGKTTDVTEINGYLGGEKIGIMEDEEIQKIFKKKYHVSFNYSRAGSLDMVTADQKGKDYLFPSSKTALEFYKEEKGNPISDDIIFNTPIVLYSHKAVAEALMKDGTVSQKDGVYYADMKKITDKLTSDTTWADIGLSELYGKFCIDTTDPAKSNSGNMFAALLATMLCDGNPSDETKLNEALPQLKTVFENLGYMENSSSDLFNQFIRTGMGAKPIVVGYENQIIEYAAENPDKYKNISDDIVMIYPTPTVWSSHIYIALDDVGKKGVKALCDEDVQKLAWEKHGFRTGDFEKSDKESVSGVAKDVNSVINMPDVKTMKKIISELED